MTAQDKTALFLLNLGIPANKKGYYALITAIKLVKQDTTYFDKQIMGRLYPDIAKELNCSSGSVERSIRHAIERMYAKGAPPMLEANAYLDSGKISNGEFIAWCVEMLRLEG